jgi:hypothetical protein
MATEKEVKQYNVEERPIYRGKAENFDLARVGQKRRPPTAKRPGPKSLEVTPPSVLHQAANPTPQRNESLLAESIFGVDVTITEIHSLDDFTTSFAMLPAIAADTFNQCQTDERHMGKLLAREEMSYYATSLLWMKLIEVKAKQGREALTSVEESIREAAVDAEFNVPQPIYAYLSQIGQYTDEMGKTTDLQIPELPVVRAGGMGGYHAAEITEHTHTLFEEVPSLGIAGDMVMALCEDVHEPVPNFRIQVPANSRVNENLVGLFQPIGPRRLEIKQRLAGQGITSTAFPEFIPNTRFNLKYIKSISDIIGRFETFTCEKVRFAKQTASGGETQVVITCPTPDEDLHERWTIRSVQATSAAKSSTAVMGAAFMFGFQTYKEPGSGANLTCPHATWCCLQGQDENGWVIPQAWIDNRNQRRNLPPRFRTEIFRTLSKRQDLACEDIIRRMVKTQR